MSVGDSSSSLGTVATVGFPAWTDETAPSMPTDGDLWLKPSTNALSVYYSGTWRAVSGGGGGGTTLPTAATAGSLLVADTSLAWVATSKLDSGRF